MKITRFFRITPVGNVTMHTAEAASKMRVDDDPIGTDYRTIDFIVPEPFSGEPRRFAEGTRRVDTPTDDRQRRQDVLNRTREACYAMDDISAVAALEKRHKQDQIALLSATLVSRALLVERGRKVAFDAAINNAAELYAMTHPEGQ